MSIPVDEYLSSQLLIRDLARVCTLVATSIEPFQSGDSDRIGSLASLIGESLAVVQWDIMRPILDRHPELNPYRNVPDHADFVQHEPARVVSRADAVRMIEEAQKVLVELRVVAAKLDSGGTFRYDAAILEAIGKLDVLKEAYAG